MKPEEIIEIRKKLQLTQEEFARIVGVTVQSINRWEKNRQKPMKIFVKKMQEINE